MEQSSGPFKDQRNVEKGIMFGDVLICTETWQKMGKNSLAVEQCSKLALN